MDEPALGRIIWTDVVDPQGKEVGEHAVIILTSKEEYDGGKPLKGVVISTKLHHGTPESMVMMKSLGRRGGHPATRLTKKCAAMCNWIVEFKESDINRYGGRVFGNDMEDVLRCVRANEQNE